MRALGCSGCVVRLQPSLLLVLAAVAALVGQGQTRQQQQNALGQAWNVSASEGQELADACADFGRRNVDVRFRLPDFTILDLRNTTFRSVRDADAQGGKAFSSGKLMIKGSVDSSGAVTSVIDAAMRSGMVPTLTRARICLKDAAIVNLCWDYLPFMGLPLATPMFLGLFSLNAILRTLTADGLLMYVPQSTLALAHYIGTASKSPWAVVRDSFRQQLGNAPSISDQTSVSNMTARQLTVSNASIAQLEGTFTYRSLDSEDDHLLQFMRQQGTLMAPRWCNGSLVPSAIASSPIDPMWAPVWMVETDQQLASGLVNATALASLQVAANRPVTGVLIFATDVFLPEASVPGAPLQLDGPLLLWGRVKGSSSSDPHGSLQVHLMGRSSPIWRVGPSGQLLVWQVSLHVPALPAGVEATGSLVSALALSALATPIKDTSTGSTSTGTSTGAASRRGAPIELANVTLVVPLLDYLAILTLATDNSSVVGNVRSCVDQATLQHAAQLQPSIQVLQAGGNTTASSLSLTYYTAWSVNASDLIVKPENEPTDSVRQCCAAKLAVLTAAAGGNASATPQDGDGDGSGGGGEVHLGVVIGCAVGAALLLAVLAGGALVLWRSRRPRGQSRARRCSSQSDCALTSSTALSATKPSASATACTHGPPAPATTPATISLMALLSSQEHQLLEQAQLALHPPPQQPSGQNAPGAPASLAEAHRSAMGVVAGRQAKSRGAGGHADGHGPGGMKGTGDGSGGPLRLDEPRQAIQRKATELQDQGERADTVTLQHVLGRGGGGTVYLGLWRGLPVAVKTFVFETWEAPPSDHPACRGPSEQLGYMRAVMETAISASVGHRNVVATYYHDIKRMDDGGVCSLGMQVKGAVDSFEEPAPSLGASVVGTQAYKVFLVQELCTCSLRLALQYKVLDMEPLATLPHLLHQVVCGLEYLHGLDVVHGDLTPANILLKVDQTDRSVLVKLADFGLSQRLDGQATHVSNCAAGTPFYVAPEVVAQRRVSKASDMYSFGVVAWEVFTRCQPFIIMPDGTPRPNPIFPYFPASTRPPPVAEQLIQRCLAADPQKRPTATDALGALSGLLQVPAASNANSAS